MLALFASLLGRAGEVESLPAGELRRTKERNLGEERSSRGGVRGVTDRISFAKEVSQF